MAGALARSQSDGRRHGGSFADLLDDRDEVTLLVECARGEAPLAVLGVELRNALGVRIVCRQVALGSLPRSELKARRLTRLPG